MATVIQTRDLRYRYDDGRLAIDGIDLDLAQGECLVLFGSNGAGKTTLLLHLNGLLTGEGTVTVGGLPVDAAHRREVRRRVGIVFQDADEQLLMPTVLEDVAYGPMNLGMPAAESHARAVRALQAVGMEQAANRAPYHLSGGEKRKVAIAGVLAMEPEILVLDEPTTSLDPPSQRELVKILKALPQAKIISTHNIAFARAIGNRAVFLREGKIADAGTVDEMITRFGWDINLA